jgi:hypothetical protein
MEAEIKKYLDVLEKIYDSHGCGMLTWEISKDKGHGHIQVRFHPHLRKNLIYSSIRQLSS